LAKNILVYLMSPWPNKDLLHKNDPTYLERIGCIVPCHKSEGEIGNTVKSLLQYLKPEHIVVVDNGNSTTPLDKTEAVVKGLDPKVRYLWVPIGLKSNALWKGLAELPDKVEFVMHIDDDTDLPEDFVFDVNVWDNQRTKAVSYGITMKQTGVVEKLVDFEFKQLSQFRLFQSQYSSVWFQHGIIGLWRREAFAETMKENPFLPFGEDGWNGAINLLQQGHMVQELRSCVSTFAPATIFPGTGSREQGYGAANIWKQRSERWCVTAPRRVWLRLYLLFAYKAEGFMSSIVFRILSLEHLSRIIGNLLAPLAFAQWLRDANQEDLKFALITALIYTICQWVDIFIMNKIFLRHREDLQVDNGTMFLWPFFNMLLQICEPYGHWRCILWYIPFVPMRHGLYTEGMMDSVKLKNLHGVAVLESKFVEPDSTGEPDSEPPAEP